MAIAFDAKTQNTSSAARNTVTFAHTVAAGVDMGLLLFVMHADAASRVPVNVTYGGQAMANEADLERNIGVGFMRCRVFSLKNPPTGANNVIVDWTGNVVASALVAISFSGTRQDDLVDASNTAEASSNNPSVIVNTNNNGSWAVGGYAFYGGDGDPAAEGGGVTERWDLATGVSVLDDIASAGGDRLQIVAGAATIDFTANAIDHWVMAGVEIMAVSPPPIPIAGIPVWFP